MAHRVFMVCDRCGVYAGTEERTLTAAREFVAREKGWGRTHAGGDACKRCRRPGKDVAAEALIGRLVGQGKSDQQIAESLGVPIKTAAGWARPVREKRFPKKTLDS